MHVRDYIEMQHLLKKSIEARHRDRVQLTMSPKTMKVLPRASKIVTGLIGKREEGDIIMVRREEPLPDGLILFTTPGGTVLAARWVPPATKD